MSEHFAFDDPRVDAFMATRHLAMLTTLRRDGSPHVVPVGVTLDAATGTARVITNDRSVKVRHVDAGNGQGKVAVGHVDGRYWLTIEGTAHVSRDADDIAEAVRRYGLRYRQPRENPTRVVIEIDVDRLIGNLPDPA